MRLVDTHSHLYLEEFDDDRSQVVTRACETGVDRIILPAINVATMDRLEKMCAEYPGCCFPTVGLHPEDVALDYSEQLALLQQRINEHAPGFYVAIGEIGLDFYWDATFREQQIKAFDRQLQWALEYHLPVIIHSRSAHGEMINTLLKYKGSGLKGIFHCFSGTAQECAELLQFDGFCLGIGGVLTFKKSSLPSVLAAVPLERIVLETDSPYMAPVPHRGKRNESAFVANVASFLAGSRQISVEEVAKVTTANAEQLFWS